MTRRVGDAVGGWLAGRVQPVRLKRQINTEKACVIYRIIYLLWIKPFIFWWNVFGLTSYNSEAESFI
jgi:hypothetical protein